MDETVSYHFATVKQRRENRHEIDYQLTLRQQPKQSRMCGVGEKADRRPIDPPPIVQLKVFDSSLPHAERNSYLQNPYYFMYASLMAADLDEELHLLRDGKTRSTTGSVVSSLYHLKDIDNTDAGFFVFPDLSVRMEGSYRLKLSLFEIIGKEVFHCRSIISNKFFVYSAKKFPGMEESTFLSRSFADQGLKIRIRKELRQRRKLSKLSDLEENGSDTSTSNTSLATNNNNNNNNNNATTTAAATSSSNMSTLNTSSSTSSAAAAMNTHTSSKKNNYTPGGKRARVNQNEDSRQSTWTSPMTEHNTRFYSTTESTNSSGNNAVIGTDRPPYYDHHRHPQPPPPLPTQFDISNSSSRYNNGSAGNSSSSSNVGGYTTQGNTSPNMLHINPFTSPYRSNAPTSTTTTTANSNTSPSSSNNNIYFYHQNYLSNATPSSHHPPNNNQIPPHLPPPSAQQQQQQQQHPHY